MQPGPQPSTIIYQGKKGYKMVRQYLMGDMLGEGAQGKVKEAVGSGFGLGFGFGLGLGLDLTLTLTTAR